MSETAIVEVVSVPAEKAFSWGWRIPDELWEGIVPLLPKPTKVPPLGCHRKRVDDRAALNAIFFVLRTGCQWNALNATGICFSSSAHRRFLEWTQFVMRLLAKEVAVSMDGRGRAMDNIFAERLWRTVKYEEVYLHDYATPREAWQNLTRYRISGLFMELRAFYANFTPSLR